MVRRSVEEWRNLFEAHATSGMTERRFCEKRGMCPKYFSLRKKQLEWARKGSCPSAFVLVQTDPPKDVHPDPSVVLRLGRCEWEFRGVSGDWLVSMMKALA